MNEYLFMYYNIFYLMQCYIKYIIISNQIQLCPIIYFIIKKVYHITTITFIFAFIK
jgi:hypothetical protein